MNGAVNIEEAAPSLLVSGQAQSRINAASMQVNDKNLMVYHPACNTIEIRLPRADADLPLRQSPAL